MKRAFIDANVILRYLTNDPPEMAEAALRVFTAANRGELYLIVIPITVAEVVWVLESFYGHPKAEIVTIMTQFLHSDGLQVEDLDLLTGALHLYYEKNLDFADAMLAARMLKKGPPAVYSFDHHLDRVPGIMRREPA